MTMMIKQEKIKEFKRILGLYYHSKTEVLNIVIYCINNKKFTSRIYDVHPNPHTPLQSLSIKNNRQYDDITLLLNDLIRYVEMSRYKYSMKVYIAHCTQEKQEHCETVYIGRQLYYITEKMPLSNYIIDNIV